MSEQKCSACGAAEHLRGSHWHGDLLICRPCFIVWYDPDEKIDQTDPKQVGALSLRLKAQGKFPWVRATLRAEPPEPPASDGDYSAS